MFQFNNNDIIKKVYLQLDEVYIEADEFSICIKPRPYNNNELTFGNDPIQDAHTVYINPNKLEIDTYGIDTSHLPDLHGLKTLDKNNIIETTLYIQHWQNNNDKYKQYIVKCNKLLKIDIKNSIGYIRFKIILPTLHRYYNSHFSHYDWQYINYCNNFSNIMINYLWSIDSSIRFYKQCSDITIFNWVYYHKQYDLPLEIWLYIRKYIKN